MDEEQLVEAVRANPCLWKLTDRSYKDLRARENAWKEVVQVVSSWHFIGLWCVQKLCACYRSGETSKVSPRSGRR